MADLVTKPRPAGFHHVTPVASSAMATPVAPMPFWRAPGWISRERPVPCAYAVAAMARPSARPRTMRYRRRMMRLLRWERHGSRAWYRTVVVPRQPTHGSGIPVPGFGAGRGQGESTTNLPTAVAFCWALVVPSASRAPTYTL